MWGRKFTAHTFQKMLSHLLSHKLSQNTLSATQTQRAGCRRAAISPRHKARWPVTRQLWKATPKGAAAISGWLRRATCMLTHYIISGKKCLEVVSRIRPLEVSSPRKIRRGKLEVLISNLPSSPSHCVFSPPARTRTTIIFRLVCAA